MQNLEILLENFRQKKFLVAVSGGADSMVLASLMLDAGCEFQVAHLNYKLRGADSDADQKLVEDFCEKNKIKIHIYEVSEKDQKPENSIQLWARNLRYDFFFKILEEEKLDFVVTAHHLNDELETFLINLSRSSGIRGLSGIPAKENRIFRPLLKYSKNEIYEFAKHNNIDFREDKSNKKNDYLRNKIRNKIVPELLEVSPNFLTQFRESLLHLNAVNQFYQNEIDRVFREIFISGNVDEFVLNKKILLNKPKILIVEIIRKLGFSGLEIEKIISAENGKIFISNTHEIAIKRNEIICKKKLKIKKTNKYYGLET